MKPNPIIEAAQLAELVAATEDAGIQLTRFISFIQLHNPELDRTSATLAAAFCLHSLPTIFLKDPELMQQLSAIALRLSQSKN